MTPSATAPASLVHAEHTSRQSIYVYDVDGKRYMTFSPASDVHAVGQSVMDLAAPHALICEYTRGMVASVAMHPSPARVLVIGVGAGVVPSALRHAFPALHVDAVDVDPAVIRVAGDFFGLRSDPRLALHVMDGRDFVRQKRARGETYDAILLDAYDTVYVPKHLLAIEFLAELKSALAPGGHVCTNWWLDGRGAAYQRELAMHVVVFGDCLEIEAGRNRLIVAAPGALPPASAMLRTLQARCEPLRRVGISGDWVAQRLRTPVVG